MREVQDRGWGLSPGLDTEGWVREVLAHRFYVEINQGQDQPWGAQSEDTYEPACTLLQCGCQARIIFTDVL